MDTAENNFPEKKPAQNSKPVHDNTIDNSNKSANKNDYDSEMDRYDQATQASEPSFTLEPEKGITPDPDTLNSETEKEGNNIKK